MATFKDPLRSLSFEHPSGWAYDLLSSTLTDFFFARWDRPQEILVIHLRRGGVAEDQPDEKWIENIRSEVSEKASLFDIDSPNGRVVAADFNSGQGMTQRVAFLRGAHVDIVVEQRNADMEAPDPWKALNTAIQTAVSATNQPQCRVIPARLNSTRRSKRPTRPLKKRTMRTLPLPFRMQSDRNKRMDFQPDLPRWRA